MQSAPAAPDGTQKQKKAPTFYGWSESARTPPQKQTGLNRGEDGEMKKKSRRVHYLSYIRSLEWAKKKRMFFSSSMWKNNPPGNESGWKCYCCEADNVPLDVHHRSYKRLGRENIAVDLVAVCRLCHEEIHLVGKRDKIDVWKATKKVRKLVVARLNSWSA